MIRRHMMALRFGLMLGDGITAVLVFLLVSVLRFRDGEAAAVLWRNLGIDIRLAALTFAVTWVTVLWMSGMYRLTVRWRPWTEVVADWLREGRSPTVFVHTPDNHDAPELARRFHDEVRALVPDLEALPEPEPIEPPTLF